jgi:hypothetical protein
MDNYLKGRGLTKENANASGFSSYLASDTPDEAETSNTEAVTGLEQSTEVIYQEEGAPKVEVLSVDGKPTKLLIHFEDDKVLEIDCLY